MNHASIFFMKTLLISVIIIFTSIASFAQEDGLETLRNKPFDIINSEHSFSGILLDRNLTNFIKLFECNEKEFADLMKKLNNKISYDENLCTIGTEQISLAKWGGDYDYLYSVPMYRFIKCKDNLEFTWYGPEDYSGFKSFLDTINDMYVSTQDGYKYYGFKIEEKRYQFAFKRNISEKTAYESMLLIGK